MKSRVMPSFWETYRELDESVRRSARKAYRLWIDNPFHPSLHFKCINTADNIWAVRITRGYRALGLWEEDIVSWFWIGKHDNYEYFF